MALRQTFELISGANTGIGLAVATQLAKEPEYDVIISSRNAAVGEEVATNLVADDHSVSSVQLDVTSDESITGTLNWIEHKFVVLDVLINNAGLLLDLGCNDAKDYEDLSTRELFGQSFSTNVIGAACLTEAYLPLLRKSELPHVVFVSSRMGSVSGAMDKSTTYYADSYKVYESSKAALSMLALNFAGIFDEEGGMVNAVCPGLVKTKLTNNHPWGSSNEVEAQRVVELAIASKVGPTATFSDRSGNIPW